MITGHRYRQQNNRHCKKATIDMDNKAIDVDNRAIDIGNEAIEVGNMATRRMSIISAKLE